MADRNALQADITKAAEGEPSGTEPHSRGTRIREFISVVVSLCGGVVILFATQNVIDRETAELGPRFWPTLLAWALIALSVLLVTTNVVPDRKPKDLPDPITGWGVSRLIVTFTVLIGYLASFNVLQLWLTTFISVVLLLLLFGFRQWKLLLVFPAIIAAILHVLFVVLLRVPLG